jgi:hypothetical protein
MSTYDLLHSNMFMPWTGRVSSDRFIQIGREGHMLTRFRAADTSECMHHPQASTKLTSNH